jgi:transcriptional regulator with XRE-family HTH domain
LGFYQRIGARLRTLRLRAGLSQAALGARLGLTAGAINRYEMGHRRVPLEDVPRIASTFGVSAVTLLGADISGGRADRADRVREESPVYGGHGRPDAAVRAYAKSLTPARLRALAKRAGVEPRPEPAGLRRYAELIAADFARRARVARRKFHGGRARVARRR